MEKNLNVLIKKVEGNSLCGFWKMITLWQWNQRRITWKKHHHRSIFISLSFTDSFSNSTCRKFSVFSWGRNSHMINVVKTRGSSSWFINKGYQICKGIFSNSRLLERIVSVKNEKEGDHLIMYKKWSKP